MSRFSSNLSLNVKIVVVATVTAMVAAGGPAVAHGVRHARFAHNAGKLGGKTVAQVRSRVAQQVVTTNLPASGANVLLASTSLPVPVGGGALVTNGELAVEWPEGGMGSLGAIWTEVDNGGARCSSGDAQPVAVFDTISTLIDTASTTNVINTGRGTRRVDLCGFAISDDSLVPVLVGAGGWQRPALQRLVVVAVGGLAG